MRIKEDAANGVASKHRVVVKVFRIFILLNVDIVPSTPGVGRTNNRVIYQKTCCDLS